jgi:hypothetical protein
MYDDITLMLHPSQERVNAVKAIREMMMRDSPAFVIKYNVCGLQPLHCVNDVA